MSHTGTPFHVPVRSDWLAATPETPIDPEQIIIDPHHHLWERPESAYAATDLAAELAGCGHRVVATVLVEAHAHYRTGRDPLFHPVGEVEHAAAVARRAAQVPGGPALCAGMVARPDLTAGARVGAVLDEMVEAGDGRLRGVRFSSVSHPDPAARGSLLNFKEGLLFDPEVRIGIAELAPRGLSLDAWMYHTQLDDLVALAESFPDTRMVLNHVGGPLGIGPYAGRRAEVFADWRQHIQRLAQYPNLSVKLGAFGMRLFGFDFHKRPVAPDSETVAEAIRPYVQTCIDLFGPGRCMFESNFPVDKASFSYTVIWNAFKRLTGKYSEEEKHALFTGTAAGFYNIDLDVIVPKTFDS